MTAVPSSTATKRAAENLARAFLPSPSRRSSPHASTSSSRVRVAAVPVGACLTTRVVDPASTAPTPSDPAAGGGVGAVGGAGSAAAVPVAAANLARPSAAGPVRGGGGGGGGLPPVRGTDGTPLSASAASNCSTRRVRASRSAGSPLPAAADAVSRTRATSRSTLGSGDRRISTRAVPSTSSARVVTAGVTISAKRSARSRSAAGNWVGGTPMATRKASRRAPRSASPVTLGSRPRAMPAARAARARPGSRSARAASNSSVEVSSSVIPPATTLSRAERASRADPRPARTAWVMPSSSTSRPASATTSRTSDSSSTAVSRFNSRCWERLRMVSTTLCGSVVARTKITWSGGSSSVLSRAFSAPAVSMWTSSRRYTLVRPGVPRATLASRSRMSSTLLLDAASSSCRSNEVPASMDTQDSHVPHGSPSTTSVQFSALARTRAAVVLPVPRGPLSR